LENLQFRHRQPAEAARTALRCGNTQRQELGQSRADCCLLKSYVLAEAAEERVVDAKQQARHHVAAAAHKVEDLPIR
jgi:hypothetical protein